MTNTNELIVFGVHCFLRVPSGKKGVTLWRGRYGHPRRSNGGIVRVEDHGSYWVVARTACFLELDAPTGRADHRHIPGAGLRVRFEGTGKTLAAAIERCREAEAWLDDARAPEDEEDT